MKTRLALALLFALLVALCAWGQTFQRSLPFLARLGGISSLPGGLEFLWLETDITNYSIWTDSVKGTNYVIATRAPMINRSGHAYFAAEVKMQATNSPSFPTTNYSLFMAFNPSQTSDQFGVSDERSRQNLISLGGNLGLNTYRSNIYWSTNLICPYTDGQLVDVAVVRLDGTTNLFYTNGVFANGVNWGGLSTLDGLGFNPAVGSQFKGYLHEIRVYSTALSLSECVTLHTNAVANYPSSWEIPTNAITAEPSFWYRADEGVYDFYLEPVTNAAYTRLWMNSASRFDRLYQENAASRPAWFTDGIASRPFVYFSGSVWFTNMGYVAVSQPTWWFTVLRLYSNNIANANHIWDGYAAGGRQTLSLSTTESGTGYMYANNAQINLPAWRYGTNWAVLSLRYSGSTSQIRTNGVYWYGGTCGTAALSGVYIGANVSAGNRLSGEIAEIITYAADLTTNQVQAVEDYLGNKYGLTISH